MISKESNDKDYERFWFIGWFFISGNLVLWGVFRGLWMRVRSDWWWMDGGWFWNTIRCFWFKYLIFVFFVLFINIKFYRWRFVVCRVERSRNVFRTFFSVDDIDRRSWDFWFRIFIFIFILRFMGVILIKIYCFVFRSIYIGILFIIRIIVMIFVFFIGEFLIFDF